MTHPLPLDVEQLLAQEPFVRALARSLLRDEADDVVQQTWLCALACGAQPIRRPRPWLAGIARNVASNLRRGSARRAERERAVAAPEPVPSSLELMEREEQRRALVVAVDQLPPPLRTVMLLRYFEGRPPRAIAVQLGLPVATVWDRLHRALTQLRARLDAEHAGDRKGWLLPLAAPFAAPRAAAGAGTFLTLWTGVLLMTAKVKTLAGAAILLLCGVVLWPVAGEPASVPGTGPLDPLPQDAVTAERPGEPAESRRAVASAPSENLLAGRVLFADSRSPATGAALVVRPPAAAGLDRDATPRDWRTGCDAEGRFAVAVGDATVVDVEVSRPGCVRRRLPLAAVATGLEILLVRASRLVVEVRQASAADADTTEPVRGAPCQLVLRGDNDRKRCFEDGVTDERGEVAFHVTGSDVHLIVKRPGLPCHGGIFPIAQGQERVRVVLPTLGEVTGRVVDKRSGLPLSGATLTATYEPELRAVTDADGMFRLPHDAERNGSWRVDMPGYATVFQRVFPQKQLPARIPDVQLEGNAALIGSLAGFGAGARVTAVSETEWSFRERWTHVVAPERDGLVRLRDVPPGTAILVHARDLAGRQGCVTARAAEPGQTVDFGVLRPELPATVAGTVTGFAPDAPVLIRVEVKSGTVLVDDVTRIVQRGQYRIAGLSPGAARISAVQGDVRSRYREVVLTTGGEQRADIDLGPTITGVVQDESGAGVADVIVAANDAAGAVRGPTAGARTDEVGRFVCVPSHPEVAQNVTVWNMWRDRVIAPEKIESVTPGGPPLRFAVRKAALVIRGSVDAATLKAIGIRHLRIEAEDAARHRSSAQVEADGTFAIPVQDIGPHVVEVQAINESGIALGIDRVPQVKPLRDVFPGGEPIVLRWSER